VTTHVNSLAETAGNYAWTSLAAPDLKAAIENDGDPIALMWMFAHALQPWANIQVGGTEIKGVAVPLAQAVTVGFNASNDNTLGIADPATGLIFRLISEDMAARTGSARVPTSEVTEANPNGEVTLAVAPNGTVDVPPGLQPAFGRATQALLSGSGSGSSDAGNGSGGGN
jgi:hypothetical protein